ncbi:MAG TPA: hypothetical protein VJ656_01300 [Pyrinomonadaceae bacterium]|nr:hypothetical protein [Pyrinomonadaceae bacterium]
MTFRSFFLMLFMVVAVTTNAYSQDPKPESAAETLERLRGQLLEVQAKEEGLRARAQQLEESLKPENIERSLAGVGSTKPEELRESRRRQLTIERDSVLAQLKILESSRQRLETAIANAEALAYQQSARPTPESQMAFTLTELSNRWLLLGGGGLAALALAAGALVFRRRIKLR